MNGKKKDGKKKQATPKSATPGESYEVGYKRPPLHTRFQPGQSGNPRGRPKGTKNLKTDLFEELNEKIVLREGGQTRRVTKQRALVKAMVNKGIQGDMRAANQVSALNLRLIDPAESAAEGPELSNENELEILQDYEQRILRNAHPTSPDSD